MFIVKDDNPDVGYQITPPTVTDAEGQPVDAGTLVYSVSSTDPAVVAVVAADQVTGTVHFGSPGVASVNVLVQNAAGNVLGSFAANFTVTSGDAAAIVGGSIIFDGLVEAPQ